MHVITRRTLLECAASHADAAASLDGWYRVAKSAQWRSIVDARATYPHADFVDPFTVFNIKGNAYRLIVKIKYDKQRLYIIRVLTHSEYEETGNGCTFRRHRVCESAS